MFSQVMLAFATGGGAMLGVSDCAHLRALMIWQRDDLIEWLFKKGWVSIYVIIFHITLTYALMIGLVWWAVEDPMVSSQKKNTNICLLGIYH